LPKGVLFSSLTLFPVSGARGNIVRGGTNATSQNVAGSITNEVIGFFFFNLPNPSIRTVASGFIHLLTAIITTNLPGG
jgi:hypothetical protein